MQVRLKLTKETKNTVRYDACDELQPVDALYVQKRDLRQEFGPDYPRDLILTITLAAAQGAAGGAK